MYIYIYICMYVCIYVLYVYSMNSICFVSVTYFTFNAASELIYFILVTISEALVSISSYFLLMVPLGFPVPP